MVVLSPELATFTTDLAAKQRLTFPILRDEALRVAEGFGIAFELPQDLQQVYVSIGIDLPKRNGDTSWRLPMPSRFVIDSGGILRSVECDPDYTHRPEPETTLAALRAVTTAI